MTLKDIREVYPYCEIDEDGEKNRYFNYPFEYGPMIESFGYDVLLRVNQKDYQGDTWVLLGDGDRTGYLVFGWGSCSGCDALQGCESYDEIDELRTRLFNNIIWKNSQQEMFDYFNSKDWETEFYGREKDFKMFLKEAKKLLGSYTINI